MRNAAAARPKPEQGFHLEIYGGKWESAMTTHSRRETARRRRHRTGQRHGKAFASVYTLPTQAPPHRRPHNSPRRLTSSQPSMQSTITHTPLLHRPEPAKAAKGPVVETRLATVATSARSPAAPPPRPVGAAGGCHRSAPWIIWDFHIERNIIFPPDFVVYKYMKTSPICNFGFPDIPINTLAFKTDSLNYSDFHASMCFAIAKVTIRAGVTGWCIQRSDIGGGDAASPAKEVYCSGYAGGLQQEILCWESRRTETARQDQRQVEDAAASD
uniref:Uncharacterized protein n=1 Tax=Oryza sativa subsp. japonica TaxID=39947 RepID=Q2QML9_ORYSJ|nr:hypothetical protein LOC_Os12g40720 [Oryza sativa Japonica Group]